MRTQQPGRRGSRRSSQRLRSAASSLRDRISQASRVSRMRFPKPEVGVASGELRAWNHRFYMGLQTKRLCTQDRRGGSWWGSELFCIQCVVSLGPAGRRNVRCCVLSDYACLLAQSLLRTSVAGSGWVLPKHRLIS